MTQDRLLAATDREEALSRAYVQAVAAGAGYLVATRDFDRDGIDCEIKAGGPMRPALGIQLKATVNLGECVTLLLPEVNRLDIASLRMLMEQSRTGVI